MSLHSIQQWFCRVAPLAALFAMPVRAATIPLDLRGNAGEGLLGGNIVPTAVTDGGGGGEFGVGILFNDVSNLLTINVQWGAGNGFSSLTGAATAGHLHGPTADGGVAALSESAGIRYTLSSMAGWNSNPNTGGFSNALSILPSEVPALCNGQFYLLIYTAAYPAGEIRGNLVPVPEPCAVLAIALLPLLRRSRRG